jgi:hypothetical protein
MPRRPSGELPWTPQETEILMSHAEVIASLREKVERNTASPDEQKRFAKAVFALEKSVKDKEQPTGSVILAESKEGREIRFDLVELRKQWVDFYTSHGLGDLLKDPQGHDLLPADIRLTPGQIEFFKEKAKEGYTRVILVPAGIEQHLQELKANLTDGLGKDKKGNPVETYLHDYDDKKGVASSFPNLIETTDPVRKNKPYLLLTNPTEALLPESKNKSAGALLAEFQASGLSGLSLADFFIEEREHFNKTGKHLIDGSTEWSWLLASRDAASRVLNAVWDPDYRQVRVDSYVVSGSDPGLGARPSVVLTLEP